MTILPVALAIAAAFHATVSPETAVTIMEYAVNEEYHEFLDFNGDGELSVVDAVGVLVRYNNNISCGNSYVVNEEEVMEIISENWNDDVMYWEIDFVEDDVRRMYEFIADKVTSFHVYIEFENYSAGFWGVVNPFEEYVGIEGN